MSSDKYTIPARQFIDALGRGINNQFQWNHSTVENLTSADNATQALGTAKSGNKLVRLAATGAGYYAIGASATVTTTTGTYISGEAGETQPVLDGERIAFISATGSSATLNTVEARV